MSVQPGDPAPDIDLVDEQDRPWRLSDHQGRPVLLQPLSDALLLPAQAPGAAFSALAH